MAVVKLGRPVKSNLGGDNGAMAYIINPAKTDGGRLVSSNYERTRTDYDALAEGMLDDNRRSPQGIRKDSRLAYHIKLSFSPDDPVTPERVHELGVEFARRITGGEYRFVVATHTDRHHLHDHIMVCAASRYGKHLKAELPKDIIDQWRAVSDEICRREGLSVVFNPVVEEQARKMRDGMTAEGDDGTSPARDPKYVDEAPVRSANEPEATARKASGGEPLERRYGMSMEEIYASAKGLGVKDRLRMLIDLTSSTAENFEDWKDMLDIRGVGVEVRGRHLTYTLKDTGFKIRDAKLGQAYDMTNIMAGLQSTPVIPIGRKRSRSTRSVSWTTAAPRCARSFPATATRSSSTRPTGTPARPRRPDSTSGSASPRAGSNRRPRPNDCPSDTGSAPPSSASTRRRRAASTASPARRRR